MKPKVGTLIPTPLRKQLFDEKTWKRLHEIADVIDHDVEKSVSSSEASRQLADCDMALGSWWTAAPNEEILSAAPRLRLWIHAAGSVKSFDWNAISNRNVTVGSCKGAIAECVAQFVLGEIIVGLRQLWPNALANRQGPTGFPPNMKVLSSSRIAVIGASEVGRLVIEKLRPFNCEIDLYDPFIKAGAAKALGVNLVNDLVSICREHDVVTLHTPPLPSTQKLLNAVHFQAMRDDTIFINTSRGECIDETALIAELEKKRLFAFLDVSTPEPAAAESPLRRLPNVVYSSHIAGPPSFLIGQQVVSDIESFLYGKPPRCVVTKDMLERIA
jgi:phosphoglycerate dehydrogenase-like enzyme